MNKKDLAKKEKYQPTCEDCEHFDFDEELGEHVCGVGYALDEDDYRAVISSTKVCPYFKFYDEYKFVQTQN